MQKDKDSSYHSKKILGQLFDSAKKSYLNFQQQMTNTKCKIYSIKKFFLLKYTDAEIKQAYEIMEQFSKDIKFLLKLYRLDR